MVTVVRIMPLYCANSRCVQQKVESAGKIAQKHVISFTVPGQFGRRLAILTLPFSHFLKYCFSMQSVKQNAIKAIEQLPDESTFEDIMEQLLFMQKVEEGLKDIRQGRVISHEDVKKRLSKMVKSLPH